MATSVEEREDVSREGAERSPSPVPVEKEDEDEGRKRERDPSPEASSKRPREVTGRQVYVGNLDFKTSARDIEEEFSRFGKVDDVFIPVDGRRNPRGFCFVTFSESSEAEAACDGLHEKEFQGRTVRVNIARPRPPPRERSPPPRSRRVAKIYVAGLPSDVNEREIEDLYHKYGRIDDIVVRRSTRTGKIQGVVTFDNYRDAQAAARETDGMRFERDVLRVDLD